MDDRIKDPKGERRSKIEAIAVEACIEPYSCRVCFEDGALWADANPANHAELSCLKSRLDEAEKVIDDCVEGFEGSFDDFWKSPMGHHLGAYLAKRSEQQEGE